MCIWEGVEILKIIFENNDYYIIFLMYGQSDYILTKVLLNRFYKIFLSLLVFVFYLRERGHIVFIQDLIV